MIDNPKCDMLPVFSHISQITSPKEFQVFQKDEETYGFHIVTRNNKCLVLFSLYPIFYGTYSNTIPSYQTEGTHAIIGLIKTLSDKFTTRIWNNCTYITKSKDTPFVSQIFHTRNALSIPSTICMTQIAQTRHLQFPHFTLHI